MSSPEPAAPRARLDSIDLLRGVVMVLMALDHVRDIWSNGHIDPMDLAHTTPSLYVTRWITHFCAPVFCLLAGTGAHLSRKPVRALSWFLLTRGLWLIVLELTVVHVGFFGPQIESFPLITIWALGCSMMALGGLVWLPRWALALVTAIVLCGHNALDGFHGGGALWKVFHDPGAIVDRPTLHVWIGYPIGPWIAVMSSGYLLGPVFQFAPHRRRRTLALLGAGAIALFIVLRIINRYGDTNPWTPQADSLFSLFSFLNVRKYPPSLDYVLATLGPSLLALAALDRVRASPNNPFLIFGRVPMFYYLIHLYFIRVIAGIGSLPRLGLSGLTASFHRPPPDGYGVGLVGVYIGWVISIAALYLPCRWFAGVKQRSRNPLLSYL